MCVKLFSLGWRARPYLEDPPGFLDEVGAPGVPTPLEEIIAEKAAGGRKVIVISDVATGK